MSPVIAMFGLGYWELLIVAGVVLLLFGNRLPSVMRSMGSGISQFKVGLAEDPDHAAEEAHKPEADAAH